MKKVKQIKPFFFKDKSNQDMADLLNKEYPINLKYNEDLIDRVCARYPFISKTKIVIIVTAIFSSIRDLLILGKILNFNNLFFDTKLHFFNYKREGYMFPVLKVKISTPPPLRKNDE